MNTIPESCTGPGLVDIQINGYAGFDFNGPPSTWSSESLHRVREFLLRRGVCAALPTLITDDPQAMLERAARYRELIESDSQLAEMFPRLHIEGPFISPEEGPRGCHQQAFCIAHADSPDLINRLQDASGGRVTIVTLAPELPGAMKLLAQIAEAGICPAIGHTAASAAMISQAVDTGAKLSTHLGNGSHQMLPRLDNYVQSQLADDRLHASFGADGRFMPLATLKNFIRAKTPALSLLITDAISAAEMPPGKYDLAGKTVEVSPDGRCQAPGEANLAGSVLTLDMAVLNTARHCDVSFDQAWAMASTQPAELIGLPMPSEITVQITEKGFVRQS